MKKQLISLILGLLLALPDARAIPAYPYPVKVMQPDGSYLTLRTHGDEFMNYITTEDGYTVVRNEKGFYVYGQLENEQLSPTGRIARDENHRPDTDKSYLATVRKHLSPAPTQEARLLRSTANRTYQEQGLMSERNFLKTSRKDLTGFRGLVILVEFSDRKFTRDTTKELFTDMINQQGYTGYMNGFEHIDYTGSVRDYFYDCSGGRFDPLFDVVGPVQIDYTQTYVKQTRYADALMEAACKAADPLIDFSNYDLDGDGRVDMVYFIFAGGGSNVSGNNTSYLWPHASQLIWSPPKDGVYLGRYACSTEFYGREDAKVLDGIGTMCHEFSHVLGLPDLYDTDYEGSGGTSIHPQRWSVMASGSYLNSSRTPCSYSLYERYALGWALPQPIGTAGVFTLEDLNASNTGYRIESSIKDEFFLLENRQQSGWDQHLPGHGMLVFRVDSTDKAVWANNTLNANPNHQHYELIRADRQIEKDAVTDSPSDPFPGAGNVTSLTNKTTPNLLSWTTARTGIILTHISEQAGIITLTTEKENLQAYTEDFEEMPVTTADASGMQGKFSKWDFRKSLVQKNPEDTTDGKTRTAGNGTQSIGAYKNGEIITTTPVDAEISSVSFMVWNPASQSVTIRFYYSTNAGITWMAAKTYDDSQNAKVEPGTSAQITFNVNTKTPTTFKISIFSGSTTEMCYIDDFTVRYDSGPTATPQLRADKGQGRLSVNRTGDCVTVESTDRLPGTVVLYAASGRELARKQLQEGGTVTFRLPARGFYLIGQGAKSTKVVY